VKTMQRDWNGNQTTLKTRCLMVGKGNLAFIVPFGFGRHPCQMVELVGILALLVNVYQ
jgi:hypothetical protein